MKIDLPVLTDKQRIMRPSFSRWDNFSNRCERLYALDILFPQPFGSPAQAKGAQIHDLFEGFLRRVRASGYDVQKAYTDYWGISWASWPDGPRERKELEPFLTTCMHLIEKWGRKVLHVEEWINVVDGMPWSGKVDLVIDHPEHGPMVVDWKTCATTTWAKSENEARRSLQLQVYCLAMDVRRAGFIYLPNSAVPLERFVTFSEDALERTKTRLRALQATIASRWKTTGLHVLTNERGMPYITDVQEGLEIDLTPFAEAGSEMPWCSKKHCHHWSRCVGRKR